MKINNIFLINARDEKSINKYYNKIDLLTINANIAALYKKSISKLIENYNMNFVIDPYTYILQVNPHLLQNDNGEIKKSLMKVLVEIYGFNEIEINKVKNQSLFDEVIDVEFLNKLIKNVKEYQINYIEKSNDSIFLEDEKEKEEILSAPYFDIHEGKSHFFYKTNEHFLKSNEFNYYRVIFSKKTDIEKTKEFINNVLFESKIKYLEIWFDKDIKNKISKILNGLNFNNEIKLIYKFVGWYDLKIIKEKFNEIWKKTFGAITAFGYGENRSVYPIGGGLPKNKIYYYKKHTREDIYDYFQELVKSGIKLENDSNKEVYTLNYKKNFCSCSVCNKLIEEKGIEGILLYSEYRTYDRKLRNGQTSQNTASSQRAFELSTWHYVENKIREYDELSK